MISFVLAAECVRVRVSVYAFPCIHTLVPYILFCCFPILRFTRLPNISAFLHTRLGRRCRRCHRRNDSNVCELAMMKMRCAVHWRMREEIYARDKREMGWQEMIPSQAMLTNDGNDGNILNNSIIVKAKIASMCEAICVCNIIADNIVLIA